MTKPWDVWIATPEWQGQVAFIVAGGTSVLTQNLELLRNRKVIAVNCSHRAVPWAEFLVFGDTRFFMHYKDELAGFKGRIISASQSISGPPPLNRVRRKSTPGLSLEPGMVQIDTSTVTAAINVAVHLAARAIVLLGLDGKPRADGKQHHHADHPWRQLNDCWSKQIPNLQAIAEDLKKLNIPCFNASPGSALADLWPVMDLEQAIEATNVDGQTDVADHGHVGDWRQSASASLSPPAS